MDTTEHVAITRSVKPGYEHAFEREIRNFFARTAEHPGTLGALLIKPIPGSGSSTFGILRSFASQEDRDRFYRSETFEAWERQIQPMVEPGYRRTRLHGLEAFFSNPAHGIHPPKWKMALITWIGVWPSVFILSALLGPLLGGLPGWLSTAIVTFFVVAALSWGVMPVLTSIARPWLRPLQPEDLTLKKAP